MMHTSHGYLLRTVLLRTVTFTHFFYTVAHCLIKNGTSSGNVTKFSRRITSALGIIIEDNQKLNDFDFILNE